MTDNDKILEIKGLDKVYPNGFQALYNVDLEIYKGEFIILLGLSGSGKSTFLRCINRLIEPTKGQIIYNQQDLTRADKKLLRFLRRHIAMIFQEFNLITNMSACFNVLCGRLGYLNFRQSLLMVFNKKLKSYAKANLERVGLLHLEKQKVKKLSGGQKQRVAIARALMQEPELFLADEPVASLDPATADSVMKYLGKLNKEDNITVICSLHFLSLARKYGSRVVALKDGRIVFDGLPKDIDAEKFKSIYGQEAEEMEIH